jgi:carboxyl-terminal processing protease
MRRSRPWLWVLAALAAATLACNTLLPPRTPAGGTPAGETEAPATRTQRPTRTPAAPGSTEPAATPAGDDWAPPEGVRACAYDPAAGLVAEMPPAVVDALQPTPYPPAALPTNTPVEAAVTERQLGVFQELVDTITQEYIDPAFNGRDWPALVERYRQVVAGGLTEDDFYFALNNLLTELGDEHSYVESPAEVAESDAELEGNISYVGIGVLVSPIPGAGGGVIILTFPGGAAREAGLQPHDLITAVDGQPLLDADGALRDVIRGPEGSQVTLTIQRLGQAPFDLTLDRRPIRSNLPIDFCLVPHTQIGYIFLPGLDDETIPGQVQDALAALGASGDLAGLVIDNRQNGGGASTVLEGVLELFTDGTLGHFVSREDQRALRVEGVDVAGSLDAPLVVLVDVDTVSYGEVLSGVLQSVDDAYVIGQTTLGNVETLWGYSFEDGSRAWIAKEAFQPLDQPVGVWEDTGIVPDQKVPTRWDLFTEATDPALAAAVDVLTTGE